MLQLRICPLSGKILCQSLEEAIDEELNLGQFTSSDVRFGDLGSFLMSWSRFVRA